MVAIKINGEELRYNNIIYVDANNGDDENGDGGKNTPFRSLQIALNHVNANNNEAIYLNKGFYTVESFYDFFNKQGVDFIGEGLETRIEIYQSAGWTDGDFHNNFYRINFSLHPEFSQHPNYDSNGGFIFGKGLEGIDDTYNIGFYNCSFNDNNQISHALMIVDGTNHGMMNIEKFEIHNCSFLANAPILLLTEGDSRYNKIFLKNVSTNYSSYSELKNSPEPTVTTSLTNVTYDNEFNITSFGWNHTGTEENPDGTQAHIGVYGGKYAWGVWNSTLILSNGEWKTYDSETGWQTVSTLDIPTEQTFLNHGIIDLSIIPQSAWRELGENEIKISYYDRNPNKEEITVIIETEPFTFYDEMGDSAKILYYTDNLDITDPKLEIETNYSPIDELDDVFEVVTWTGNMEDEKKLLEIICLPEGQLVFQESDINADEVKQISLSTNLSNDGIIRIIASADQGVTWKTFDGSEWKIISPEKEMVKIKGMTPDDLNSLTDKQIEDLLQGSPTIRFAYYLEQEELTDEANIDQIQIKTYPVATETPALKGINIAFDEVTIEGRLKDLEKANAVNISKLQFKTNALMEAERTKLHDLVVDTFETTNNVDLENTTAFYSEHDKQFVGPGEIYLNSEELPEIKDYLFLVADHQNAQFEYSFDKGETWSTITPNVLTNIQDKKGNELIIKILLSSDNAILSAIAFGWI